MKIKEVESEKMSIENIQVDADTICFTTNKGEEIREPLVDLQKIYVLEKLSNTASEYFHIILFAIAFIYPWIFGYFLWRVYKAYKAKDKKYLLLLFKNNENLVKENLYIIGLLPVYDIKSKISELEKTIINKGLTVELIEKDRIDS